MQYLQAKRIADRIVEILSPTCTTIHIAGSIRREKPEVKDIEVCAIPHYYDSGLFSDFKIVDLQFKKAVMLIVDTVEKGDFDGRYMAIKLKGCDMKLDLFLPKPDDYYRQLAIRTGSADYSAKVIAAGWRNIGWVGVPELGLRKEVDCEGTTGNDGKTTWKLINQDAEKPPVWANEAEFFTWLGIPILLPKNRN